MNSSKMLLLATYATSIFTIIFVIYFFNKVNGSIERNMQAASTIVDPEFETKFIEKVRYGEITTEQYVEILSASFKSERAHYEAKKNILDINSAITNILSTLIFFQIFLLSLYVMETRKRPEEFREGIDN